MKITSALTRLLLLALVLVACSNAVTEQADDVVEDPAPAEDAPEESPEDSDQDGPADSDDATSDDATSDDGESGDSGDADADSTDDSTDDAPTTSAPEIPAAIAEGLPGELLLLDGNGQVTVLAPDGTGAQEVSDSAEQNSQPTWSTSGDRVAWSSLGPDGPTLSISNSDGSNVQTLDVPAPAFYLSWSPNEEWIGGLRPAAGGMEMFIANSSLTDTRVISMAQPFYFDWVSDEALVASLLNQFIVDISTDAAIDPLSRPLQRPLGAFQAPAILPDGDILAALVDGQNTLTRLTGNQGAVIGTAEGPMFISASPDGTQVAVLVPPAGAPQPQPDSQVIAFQFDTPVDLESGQVTIIDLVTGDVEMRPEEDIVSVQWSPDGDTLAMLQAGAQGGQWLFDTETDLIEGARFTPSQRLAQRYLPFFDQYNLSSTWWSPDGEAIVFSGSVDGQAGVFVDRVFDDEGPAWVSDGDIAFWSPN